MTDKEAMKLALDALETEVSIDWTNNDEFNASAEKMHEAITALKERLADPMREVQRLGQEIEQEPVVWADYESKGIHHKPVAWMDADGNVSDNNDHKCFPIPLYTSPPQPEQEPVAWMYVNTDGECEQIEYGEPFDDPSTTPLYTHPPQRTEQEPHIAINAQVVGYVEPQRKPLTDKAITQVIDSMPRGINGWMSDWDLYEFARAIEAAHDIKENT